MGVSDDIRNKNVVNDREQCEIAGKWVNTTKLSMRVHMETHWLDITMSAEYETTQIGVK